MIAPAVPPRRPTFRDLLILKTPALWPTWPLLAVVRHKPGDEKDLGVLCDFEGLSGKTGFQAVVFLTNIFTLPETLDGLLALPKEEFSTVEDLMSAGWVVD